MARRSKRKAKSLDKVAGIALALLGVAVLGALGAGAYWLKKSKPVLDAQTGCPVQGPTFVHMVLFDQTDPISPQQGQQVKQRIERYKSEASFGYRFDLYTFDGDTKNVLKPVLQLCSPGRPDEANELIANPQLEKKRYEERFAAVLDRTVGELLREQRREMSPLIESLKASAVSSFGAVQGKDVRLRVTIVSDLIQHSPNNSHFKAVPDFAQLSRTMTWSTIAPQLKGAEVDILYLLRPEAKRVGKPIQDRGHQLFWEQLIQAANGTLLRVDPI
jgi:hypothetical protein